MAHQEVNLPWSVSILSCSWFCCTYQPAARIFSTVDHASSTMKPQIIVVRMGQSVTTEKFASDLAASLTFISAMIVVVNAIRRCELPHPLPALQLHLTQDTQGISFVRGPVICMGKY